MPWFKIDDGFHGHPKVVELSLGAVGLWTLSGSWCAKYLTDGFVPDKTVVRLGGSRDEAGELVAADLWLDATGGYAFKDWADYQPLKADVEAERLAAQERMKKVRAAKKGVRPNEQRTTDERSQNVARSSQEVRVAPSQSLSQSLPIPSPKKKAQPAARYSTEFEEWWLVYPRKQGKKDAFKAYKDALKDGATQKTLIAGAQAYALLNIGQEKSFLKFPGGWLRGERWEDEQIVNVTRTTTTHQPRECIDHPGYPLPCDKCAREGGGRDF